MTPMSYFLRCLCLLTASALPLVAGVTAGLSTSTAAVNATAVLGALSDSEISSDTGTYSVRLKGTRTLHVDPAGPDFLQVRGRVAVHHTHSVFNPSSDYLSVAGSGSTTLTLESATGLSSATGATVPTVTLTSAAPDNQRIFYFDLAVGTYALEFQGTVESATPSAVSITLQYFNVSRGWTDLITVPTDEPSFSFSPSIIGGAYRLITSIGLTAGSPAPASPASQASYSYTLAVGTPPTVPYEPIPGEYTHPLVGTVFTDSPKLTVQNPTILSEVDQGNGTTAVRVSAQLTNTSDCPWSHVTATIPTTFAGGPDITLTDSTLVTANDRLDFNDIAAHATEGTEDPADALTAIVPNSGLAAFRASILSGARFQVTGRELWVFIYPVEIVDNDQAADYQENLANFASRPTAGSQELIFEGQLPDFQPGTYYLEHEEYSKILPLPHSIIDPLGGPIIYQGFDRLLPFLVTGVERRETSLGTIYRVTVRALSFLDVVKHGTVRSTVEPLDHPSGFIATERALTTLSSKAHPIHFNRINIANAIDLSGSFLLNPGPIGVEFEMRNRTLESFLVTANFKADATLLVETKNAADNTGDPIFDQQKRLFSFPLFSLVLPAGISLTPQFSLDVGAAVNAPTGLSVPIQSSLEIDITAGMKNGEPFYEAHHTATPPKISTPAIHQQLQASAEAWIAAQLLCTVTAPSGAIGGGPTVGARVGGAFALAPLGDPWWSVTGQLELLGGVELQLAGLIPILDEEKVIGSPVPLFAFDAGGPLLPPPASRSVTLPDNPGIRPIGGHDTRWARALRATSGTSPGTVDNFIHRLTGSDDLIAGGATDISRYGPDGALKWTLAATPNTLRSVPTPDGGFTVLSNQADKNLAHFDGEGNRLWSVIHRPASGGLELTDLAVRTVASQPQYFAVGTGGTSLDDNRPVVLKFDHTGTLLWSKSYLPAPVAGETAATSIQRALVTADGHLVLIGSTGADIASGRTGANLVNITSNGFVMKIDADTGACLWTTLLAISPLHQLTSLTESPDGTLYLGGSILATALEPSPSLLIAKLTATGALVDSVLIGSIFGDGAQPTGYTSSPVPHNGGNAFDRIHAMLWLDGTLWIGGNVGTPGASIITDGQSAFTARLTPELGVTRFAIHAGTSADFIGALADGGDGLLACGWTRSFLPWPAGAAGENDPTPVARLIAKLPWEGLLRFHELSNGLQPAADDPAPTRGSHFVYPRTIAASDTTFFSARFPAGEDEPDELVASSDLPMTVADYAVINGFFPPGAPAKITPLNHHQLDYVPAEAITDFSSYANYHQVDAKEDGDLDGISFEYEFYYGTDPFAADTVNLQATTHPLTGATTYAFPRSILATAQGSEAPVERSHNLIDWTPVPATSLFASPQSNGDLLYLDPLNVPGESRTFYRLRLSTAP